MTDKRVQFFMSYAWNDNSLPPGDHAGRQPFVSTLAGQVEYWFNMTNPKPQLWWDRDNIDDGQQFRPAIQTAIDESSFFLIVLSEHWLASEYCQNELRMFRQRWQHESDFHFKHRIILAHKSYVAREDHPALFPEQRGLQFFSMSGHDRKEVPFFRLGKANEEFHSTAEELAQILIKRAKHEDPEQPPPPPPPRGLKVYLAKPAPDMREQYLRVHRELAREGFNVVPAATDDIPLDAAAINFINRDLKDAKVSIHLIGKSVGPAPADLEHIAKLQLAKAAERHAASEDSGQDSSGFRRIIWVPKIFEDPSGQVSERDPIETFKSFGSQRPNDRIEGDSLSPFVQFIVKHLRMLDEPEPHDHPTGDGQVYLCHEEGDTDYAIEVAALLEEHDISYVMPAYYNTTDSERAQFHKNSLSECTAVVMCWASASEVWARAQSKQLRDWQSLGRKQHFACRGLIAGPPPHSRKDERVLRRVFPPKEIDLIMNWAEKADISALKKHFVTSAETPRHE
jgi:hypothetical protein